MKRLKKIIQQTICKERENEIENENIVVPVITSIRLSHFVAADRPLLEHTTKQTSVAIDSKQNIRRQNYDLNKTRAMIPIEGIKQITPS